MGRSILPTVDELADEYPSATRAECERCLEYHGHDASFRLGEMLEWRRIHCEYDDPSKMVKGKTDEEHWEYALRRARSLYGSDPEGQGDIDNDVEPFPRAVFCHKNGKDVIRDCDGNFVLHIVSGYMNQFAVNLEFQTTAICLYLDQKFDRDEKDKLTLVFDVRAGEGWTNNPVTKSFPFDRLIMNTLSMMAPARLGKCIITPMPRPAVVLWNTLLKPFLHASARELVILVAGGAGKHDPMPTKRLLKYFNEDDLEIFEQTRIARLKAPSS